MRTRWNERCAIAIAVVVMSCSVPSSDGESTCEDDAELCPESSQAATSVTCDCRCTLGVSEDEGLKFEGVIDVCLPAPLNPKIASDVQMVARQALTTREFDQRVFKYCSQDVARFIRTTVKSRAKGVGSCAMPVRCECTTKGASRDSGVCHAPCPDVPCDEKNCPAVLWHGGKLDGTACTCSRATACGAVVPAEEDPGFCRDWLTASWVKRLDPE